MDATRRTMIAALLLAVLTVALWWGWLGWDTERIIDPVTSVETGPYEVWQVAGCVLTLAALAFVAGRWLSPLVVAPVMTVAFTAAWSWRAATSSDTGTWVIGAFLVFVGMAAGSTLVSFAGHRFLGRR
ncbi:hypothetical protein [Plantactinospora sp. GCM10030261]|uniref:hypothetical protein n=1 Tax=Plantactinospora sp. GCM10030261 TaxID=3273420 RepID=UPI00360E7D0F